MRSLPPLRTLMVFEAVGRCESAAAAARELRVSPGAISQQLRILEDHLGVALLQRSGRRLELTEWGRIYHGEVRRAFDLLAEAGDALRDAHDGSGLMLSALSSVATKWIGRRIFDWQALHPDSVVHVEGSDSEPDLLRDSVDFRISYGQPRTRHFAELFTDWVAPACAPALIADDPPRSPADILRFPLLHVAWSKAFRPGPAWKDWAAHVGAEVVPIRAGLTFTLGGSAIDAAVAGRGFVLAQMALISDDLAEGRLVIPFDRRLPLPEPYCLSWSPASLGKPFAGELHRWLLAAGRSQRAASAP